MSEKDIIINESLASFFYKNLDKVNKKSLCPIPQEFVWYSSEVLSEYAFTDKFFDLNKGRINEKILGFQLLEAQNKTAIEQKKIYKDIGDSVLVQLGFFSERINKKTLPADYYIKIGKSAYFYMENLDCTFCDIPNFYKQFSSSIESVIRVLLEAKAVSHFDDFNNYLLGTMKVDKATAC